MNSITERDVANMWDENAALWASQVGAGRDVFREIVNNPIFFGAFLPDLRGRDVIDLGCGDGCNTRILAQRGAKMTGIDISPHMIAAACAAEASEPLGINYRVGSFAALEGIDDASFDAAISTMALMDAPDFGAAAAATFRVLRDGGGFTSASSTPASARSVRGGSAMPKEERKGGLWAITGTISPISKNGGSVLSARTRRRPSKCRRFPTG